MDDQVEIYSIWLIKSEYIGLYVLSVTFPDVALWYYNLTERFPSARSGLTCPCTPTCGNRGEFENQGLPFVSGDATIRVTRPAGRVMGVALAARHHTPA
jgi:hypothetical protein